jgi:hypothetical protein
LNRVIDVFIETTRQDLELALDDICPYCYGRLECEVDLTKGHSLPEFATRCSRCGVRVDVPAVSCLITHPAGVSFFYDHGIDIRQRPFWAPEFYNNVSVETTAQSEHVEITVELDDDWIRGRFDESLTVREIERKEDFESDDTEASNGDETDSSGSEGEFAEDGC